MDYKITFMNSNLENTNLKGDFVPKKRFETFVLKISGVQKQSQKYKLNINSGFAKTGSKKFCDL